MKKRFMSILLTVCMVAALFSGMTVSASADGVETVEYTLKSGDNVYKVCQRLGIDFYANYDWITATNKITNYSSLAVGRKLILPAGDTTGIVGGTGSTGTTGTTTTTPGKANVNLLTGDSIVSYLVPHKVSSGDTLYDICLGKGIDYNKNIDNIMKINGLKNANRIAVGRTLLLPSASAPAAGTACVAVVGHKIVAGDATFNLCRSYGIDYEDNVELMKALNGKNNMAVIKTGQTLLIPVPTTIAAGSTGGNTGSGNTGSGNTNTGSGNTNTGSGNTNTGSGNTSTGVTYKINKNTTNVNQGSYSVLVNNSHASTAASGATVTVNVTAKKGYQLDYVTVTDKDGKAISLNGTTFTMPASDVTVSVKFVSSEIYRITSGYSSNGSYTVSVNGSEANEASQGQTVKVNATPAYGYELDKIEVSRSTNSATTVEVVNKSFVMPKYDVTVKVSFRKAASYDIIYGTATNGSFEARINGSKVYNAKSGDVVNVYTEPKDGYMVDDIVVVPNDSAIKDTITVTNGSFVMPEYAVQLYVGFKGEEFNVISAATTNGSFTVSQTKAAVGTWMQVIPKADNGWAVDKVYFTDANGDQVRITSSDFSFSMPARDTTITVTFRKGNYSLSGNVAEFQKDGVKVTHANPGDTVTIKFLEKDGQTVKKVTGTYGSSSNPTTFEITDGEFIMPIGAVNVTVQYEPATNRIWKDDQAGGDFYFTIKGDEGTKVDYAKTGNTVYVTVLPDDDYKCIQVRVTDAKGNKVNFDYGTNSFVMPGTEVTVTPTFEEK